MAAPFRSLTLVVLVALVGCSEDAAPATDYTAANRDGFLAACTRPLDDPRLVTEVCSCTYDRMEDELSFDELTQIDLVLRANPDGPLPDDLVDIVSDCFIEAGELNP